MSKQALFSIGFITTVVGMTLLLRHWQEVVMVFWGVAPTFLAILGLVLMFAASLKND